MGRASGSCLPSWRPRGEQGVRGVRGSQGLAPEALPELPDHSWPEEGLDSYISGEVKAPIQAEKRMWPREKSPALIPQFLKQSLSGHRCQRPPALPEPVNSTQWKLSEYLHAAVMDTTAGHSLFWKTSGEACRKTSLPLLRSSYLLSLLG